jgi:RNA recognition motif-containing protein
MNSAFFSPSGHMEHRRHNHQAPDTINFGYSGITHSGGKLFVGCLPYSRCSHDLREIFSVYGPLVEVALLTTPEGKSKGAAFVTFVHREDAERAAAALQGYMFPNSSRGINISFATKQTRPVRQTSAPSVISSSSYDEESSSYLSRSPPGFDRRTPTYSEQATQYENSTPDLMSTPTIGESLFSILGRTTTTDNNTTDNSNLDLINEAMIKSLFGEESTDNGFPPL